MGRSGVEPCLARGRAPAASRPDCARTVPALGPHKQLLAVPGPIPPDGPQRASGEAPAGRGIPCRHRNRPLRAILPAPRPACGATIATPRRSTRNMHGKRTDFLALYPAQSHGFRTEVRTERVVVALLSGSANRKMGSPAQYLFCPPARQACTDTARNAAREKRITTDAFSYRRSRSIRARTCTEQRTEHEDHFDSSSDTHFAAGRPSGLRSPWAGLPFARRNS